MRLPESTSPMRLAGRAVIGSLMMMSPLLMIYMLAPPLHDHVAWKNLLRFIAFLVPFGFGLAISLLAEKQLRQGIKNDLWSVEELEPLHRWLSYRVLMAVLFIFPAVWLGHVISSDTFCGSSWFGILMIPLHLFFRLKTIVMPLRANEGVIFQDGRDLKPVRSEPWGKSR